MPKLRRVQAAQAYMAHPAIQTGYSMSKGGLGTVNAIVTLQNILTAHASNSIQNRIG